jgi:hypothetical protein
VFNDKSQTVFTDDKAKDELNDIRETLFVGGRECWVEEELDEDRVLIYHPLLPLDEVWLLEPERRNRKGDLKKQRRITETREHDLIPKGTKHSVDLDPGPSRMKSHDNYVGNA